MIRVVRVETLPARKGKRHLLSLTFSDGTSGVADLSKLVREAPMTRVAEPRIFRKATIEHGAVEWPGHNMGIATEALYALVHGLPIPMSIEQVQENELRVSLRELRRIAGKTQAAVAEESGLTQSALSQFESSPDHKLSALRKYVAALGGELEVAAVLGDRRIPLHGV